MKRDDPSKLTATGAKVDRAAATGQAGGLNLPSSCLLPDVLQAVYRKALPHLSPADLATLVKGAGDAAAEMAASAAAVADGLALLISVDGESAAGAGNFQSARDVPTLLQHFGGVFRSVQALAGLASQAADELEEREGAA